MTQKKFKNTFLIKGEHHQLIACKKELEKIGYTCRNWHNYESKGTYYIGVNFKKHYDTFTNYVLYAFFEDIDKRIILELPKDWNQALELASELEEIKPEFKVGDWITQDSWTKDSLSDGCQHYRIVGIDNTYVKVCYNHSKTGQYNETTEELDSKFRKSTPEEIETQLRYDAEIKGFVKGAYFKGSAGFIKDSSTKISHIHFMYDVNNHNTGLYIGHSWIYHNHDGWGTLVLSAPQITLAGYKAIFEDNIVKFGCANIHINEIKDWHKELTLTNYGETNIKIEGIKISKDKYSDILTLDHMKQIVEYYNRK